MASFSGLARQLTTARVQLGEATTSARVYQLRVFSETTGGAIGRPVVYRPTFLGIGTETFPSSLDFPVTTSQNPFISSFTTNPSSSSAPAASAGTTPCFVDVMFPRGQELIIMPGEGLCVYAASSAHRTAINILWEEP